MKFIIKSTVLFPKIKLNYNCKEEEKSGTGPGSCSGGKQSSTDDDLKKWELTIRSKMTSDEKNVIDNWGRKYDLINNYLYNPSRNVTAWKDQIADIKLIDGIMDKSETQVPMTVYRGIPFLDRLPKSIVEVGSEISLKGFTPTSTSEKWAKTFHSPDGALLEISVPKGTKAIYMHENKNMQMVERELLLNRDLKYRVTSVEEVPKADLSIRYKIKMEIIK